MTVFESRFYKVVLPGGEVERIEAQSVEVSRAGALIFSQEYSTGTATRVDTGKIFAPGQWITVTPEVRP